jgi:hypothetical protein
MHGCPSNPTPPVPPRLLSRHSAVHGWIAPTTRSGRCGPLRIPARRRASSWDSPPLHRLSPHASCPATVPYMAGSREIHVPARTDRPECPSAAAPYPVPRYPYDACPTTSHVPPQRCTWPDRAEYLICRVVSAQNPCPLHRLILCLPLTLMPVAPRIMPRHSAVHGRIAPTTRSRAYGPLRIPARRRTSSCASLPLLRLSYPASCPPTALHMAGSREIPLPPRLCCISARNAIPRAPLPPPPKTLWLSQGAPGGTYAGDCDRVLIRAEGNLRGPTPRSQCCRGRAPVLPHTPYNLNTPPLLLRGPSGTRPLPSALVIQSLGTMVGSADGRHRLRTAPTGRWPSQYACATRYSPGHGRRLIAQNTRPGMNSAGQMRRPTLRLALRPSTPLASPICAFVSWYSTAHGRIALTACSGA